MNITLSSLGAGATSLVVTFLPLAILAAFACWMLQRIRSFLHRLDALEDKLDLLLMRLELGNQPAEEPPASEQSSKGSK